MADSTLSLLKDRLHDIAGDSSSGFWSEDNQTRAINIARKKMWSGNFYEVVLRYIFDSVALQNEYPLDMGTLPRYSTWDHLEWWQTGFPHYVTTTTTATSPIWGIPPWGTVLYGGGGASSTRAPSWTTTPEPTYIHEYVGPNQFKTKRETKPTFTIRNEGATERGRKLYVFPTPSMDVYMGYVFYYFPNPEEMVTGSDTISDPLIEAYPLASELICNWAAGDLRRQEGAYGEAVAFDQIAQGIWDEMRQDMPRKTTQKQRSFRIEQGY